MLLLSICLTFDYSNKRTKSVFTSVILFFSKSLFFKYLFAYEVNDVVRLFIGTTNEMFDVFILVKTLFVSNGGSSSH